jgi:hypothetical protein
MRGGQQSKSKGPRRSNAETFNSGVRLIGECIDDDLLKMVEALCDKFSRYRTLGRTRNDLFAVIWYGTGMTQVGSIILFHRFLCLCSRSKDCGTAR